MMLRGRVNPFRQCEVEIVIRSASNKPDKRITAVVDTGFDGAMSLPPDLVNELDLPYADHGSTIVFGGAEVEFDIHAAIVVWCGEERGISVIVADNTPLIGMQLLYGYRLSVEVLDGGEIAITPTPGNTIEE